MMKVDGRTTRSKDSYYFKNLSGMNFGHLTAIERIGTNKHGNSLWRCVCDCGNEKIVPGGRLTAGRIANCGCQSSKLRSLAASRHGITAGGCPRTFNVWRGMKERCLNPKAISFRNYGARGITVCDEWLGENGFENFHNWALSNGYSDTLFLDRIDNNGNYSPENCRFVTREENSRNTRRNHHITVDGTTLVLAEWARKCNVAHSTILRVKEKGLSVEDYIRKNLASQDTEDCAG